MNNQCVVPFKCPVMWTCVIKAPCSLPTKLIIITTGTKLFFFSAPVGREGTPALVSGCRRVVCDETIVKNVPVVASWPPSGSLARTPGRHQMGVKLIHCRILTGYPYHPFPPCKLVQPPLNTSKVLCHSQIKWWIKVLRFSFPPLAIAYCPQFHNRPSVMWQCTRFSPTFVIVCEQ